MGSRYSRELTESVDALGVAIIIEAGAARVYSTRAIGTCDCKTTGKIHERPAS
jgi:hypothetical protein